MGTTRPGAMSLLDKYAQINANIEEARRRVASTRSALESANQSIENLRDEREGMLHETAVAKSELARLEERLKGEKVQKKEKLNEKERAEREHRLVKKECNDTRRQMDRERLAFLERCREFRSSCKRMRVAATLLVLDGGGAFDMEGSLSENDVWRRLQEEDLDSSDDECDGKAKPVRKGKKKKPDIEMEQVIKDEKESREAFIEAECALHAARSEHEEAVKRCNARNNKLMQQRAQLEKHRREVEELEREIGQVNDQIVKANQHAKNYENGMSRYNLFICRMSLMIFSYSTNVSMEEGTDPFQ
jgi:septal ring factor EnvC (AmiA/AmiB activator)